MWTLLGLTLGQAEKGPGFCLIRASGFSMAAGRLTLRCGFLFRLMGVGGVRPGLFLGWV